MNFDHQLTELTALFEPVSLKELDSVSFMRRVDTKYVFNVEQLPELLKKMTETHSILDINGTRIHHYETTYLDTGDFKMYLMHHNGVRERHKVRVRKYSQTKQHFFEVKRKNNKGETIKKREAFCSDKPGFSFSNHRDFLKQYSPYDISILKPSLRNNFNRITFVDKKFTERITIDTCIGFEDPSTLHNHSLNDVCIIELKRSLHNRNSELKQKLRDMRILPMTFSKYCIGLSMLNGSLKKNRFKRKIIKVNQI